MVFNMSNMWNRGQAPKHTGKYLPVLHTQIYHKNKYESRNNFLFVLPKV